MRIQKIYLETSVFNFVFADDAPDKKADTVKLFEEIKNKKFLPFTSNYVTEEIDKAPHEKKENMHGLILGYGIEILQDADEIEHLSDKYITEGIIPEKYKTDALHIAAATVNDLDAVVSWNFEHIVKRKTMIMTEVVNRRNGYNKVDIYSPSEVIRNV